MHDHRSDPARHETRGRRVALALDERHRHDAENGGSAAVHDRRAEPANHLHVGLSIRPQREVIQVLDERETGADGKPDDRGIDQQPDTAGPDQVDQDQRLEQLLEPRRHVAHVERGMTREDRAAHH